MIKKLIYKNEVINNFIKINDINKIEKLKFISYLTIYSDRNQCIVNVQQTSDKRRGSCNSKLKSMSAHKV